ncbi:MAG: hypothetical protein CSA76_04375 [Spirochaetales bacterium]|nr:MAG: hypothetical protein CSA76_04375 [Spirochaetales bacterium]
MLINKRPDGEPVRVPGFTKMTPLMMQTRTESSVYMQQTFVMDKTIKFIEEWNKDIPEERRKLTVIQIMLLALVRVVVLRPHLNRFISNFRYYKRNNISFSFVSKKTLTDNGTEVTVTMPFRPDDTLETVNKRYSFFVNQAKSDEGNKNAGDVDAFDKLPVWMLRVVVWSIKFLDKHNWAGPGILRMLPFYCTMFLTDAGSLNVNAPIHHNYEIGNVGMFVAIGKVEKEKYITEDNQISERHVLTCNYTFDDRIVDGIYAARATKILKDFVENPEKLLKAPNFHSNLLKELGLTEKGWNLWAEEGM